MSLYECEECGKSDYDGPLSPSKRRRQRQRQEIIQQAEQRAALAARREQWRKDNPSSAALADSLELQSKLMRRVFENNMNSTMGWRPVITGNQGA